MIKVQTASSNTLHSLRFVMGVTFVAFLLSFLLSTSAFAQVKPTFTINDVASVTEKYTPSLFEGYNVVTITLKSGQVVSLKTKYALFSSPKEALQVAGYVGSVMDLVALKSKNQTKKAQITTISNSIQPVVTVTGENLVKPSIHFRASDGTLYTENCVSKSNSVWECGKKTIVNSKFNYKQGTYFVALLDGSDLLASSSITVSKTGAVKNDKVTPIDSVLRNDKRFLEVTKIDNIVISAANPQQVVITAKAESDLRVVISDVNEGVIIMGDTKFSNKNGVFAFSVDQAKVTASNQNAKYRLHVRGLFDGRFYKIQNTYDMIIVDGKLKLTPEALTSLQTGTNIPTPAPKPVVPTPTPVTPATPVATPVAPDTNGFLPSVPATISGTGCTIPAGSSSCVGKLTWKIDTKATQPRIENRFTGKFVSTGQLAQTGFQVTLTPGSTMFAVRNGNTALGSALLSAECAQGSTSNGTVCVAVTPTPPTIVPPTKPVTPDPVVNRKNQFDCDRQVNTKFQDNTVACYGVWDYEYLFGGDINMCFGDTGCVIKAPVCASGSAKATTRYILSSPGNAVPVQELSSSVLSKLAGNIGATTDQIKKGIVEVWDYTCLPGAAAVKPVIAPTPPTIVPPTKPVAPIVTPVTPVVVPAPIVNTPVKPVKPVTPVAAPSTPVVSKPVTSTPAAPVSNGWVKCANQGGTCVTGRGSDEGDVAVRYGANGSYVTKMKRSNFMCHNAFFDLKVAPVGAVCEVQKGQVRGASTDLYTEIVNTLQDITVYLGSKK